ncbi:MAG: hypothetical protein QM681_09850 [Novosphingobium sp.]
MIVSLFEIGKDEGDTAGEFQLWKQRRGLTMKVPFPQGFHDLYYNPETQVLGMVTGIGTARSTAATMALGLDPRFDLSRAYWLVAGIAGIDPQDASIGSAAWARYVVDGDLAHEIDAREIPKDWKSGYFPRHLKGPNDTATPIDTSAAKSTRSTPGWSAGHQPDQGREAARQRGDPRGTHALTGYPNAQKPPFVLEGETLGHDLLARQLRPTGPTTGSITGRARASS